jgi:hypothetical protein
MKLTFWGEKSEKNPAGFTPIFWAVLSSTKELTETKKIVFNNEQKEVLFMFVNNKFTIYDLFSSNPGNALENATAIIIFVDFIFILNFVFV